MQQPCAPPVPSRHLAAADLTCLARRFIMSEHDTNEDGTFADIEDEREQMDILKNMEESQTGWYAFHLASPCAVAHACQAAAAAAGAGATGPEWAVRACGAAGAWC